MMKHFLSAIRLATFGAAVCLIAVPASVVCAASAPILSATGGKPLHLKVSPPAEKPGTPWSLVLVNGLPETFALSKGTKLGNGSWSLTPDELGAVLVLSPRAYEGAVDLDIVFLAGDNTTRERTGIKLLVWAAEGEQPMLPTPPVAAAENTAAPNAASTPVATSTPVDAPATAAVQPPAAPDTTSNLAAMHKSALPADAEDLLGFCRQLLKDKRVASARAMLEPLAMAGNAKAAHALAETYDPKALASMKIKQVKPDFAKARAWYTRAKELGDPTAQASLKALAAQLHRVPPKNPPAPRAEN